MDGFIFEAKLFLFFVEIMVRLFSSSKVNWSSNNILIAIFFKKMGPMIHYMKFLPPEATLCLYKATI